MKSPVASRLLLLLPLMAGCTGQSLFLPDPGYNDNTTGWTDNLRSETGPPSTGVSTRAREIERNLGVPERKFF